MDIRKTYYKTIEIDNNFRFSNIKYMSLNEVLLRILKDDKFYDSTIDYDIVWIKNSIANKWIHIENE